jgi:hypothetical protein
MYMYIRFIRIYVYIYMQICNAMINIVMSASAVVNGKLNSEILR